METIIKPYTNFLHLDLRELWNYRDLFYVFAWRDIKVRYKQTVLGVGWAIFQPLTTTLVFTIFFGTLAKIPSGKLPYSLFVLCGLVFWNFFSGSLSHASNSLVDNESIIKKVYFPKLILPLSSIVTNFVDFGINFLILVIYALFLGFHPSLLFLPMVILAIFISSVSAAGLGLFLSSVNVKYRDVRYILPFFIQILMFVSPVIYPTSIVRPSNKLLLAINPLTGVIEAVRSTITGSTLIDWPLILISLVSCLLLFVFGLAFFRYTERFLSDLV